MKKLKILLLIAALVLGLAGGAVAVTAEAPKPPAGVFGSAGLGFDFDDLIMPVYAVFTEAGLEFFNADFTDFDMTQGDNAGIILLAEMFIPNEYLNGNTFVNADDLAAFLEEAFGVTLPRETMGVFKYNEEDNIFAYPADGPGVNVRERWTVSGFTKNNDGSFTAETELVALGVSAYTHPNFDVFSNSPPSLWADDVTWGMQAQPKITFTINEDHQFYPMQIISIETTLYDWADMEGTFESENGDFIISLGADSRYDMPPDFVGRVYNGRVTDVKRGRDFWVQLRTRHNTAELYTLNYTLDAFLTINPFGTMTASDIFGEYGTDISGVYKRISRDVPPLPAMFDVETPDIELKDDDGNWVAAWYALPRFSGLGDKKFDAAVNERISADIIAEFKNFKENTSFGEEEYFGHNLVVAILSDFYYAIASITDQYAGGAHGEYNITMYNIDAEKEKFLTLDDVFTSGYRQTLEALLTDMAADARYQDALYPDTNEIKITDNAQFLLTDTGLVIFYPPTEIGPHASGIIYFYIPFSEISDILLPEYQQGGLMREFSNDGLFREHSFGIVDTVAD